MQEKVTLKGEKFGNNESFSTEVNCKNILGLNILLQKSGKENISIAERKIIIYLEMSKEKHLKIIQNQITILMKKAC